jgi:hypothetical protein
MQEMMHMFDWSNLWVYHYLLSCTSELARKFLLQYDGSFVMIVMHEVIDIHKGRMVFANLPKLPIQKWQVLAPPRCQKVLADDDRQVRTAREITSNSR